jgi:intracellular sulfur oxidation DsrE/DsrF family protein
MEMAMNKNPGRRAAMQAAGMSLAVGGLGLLGTAAHASPAPEALIPGGASALDELTARLAKAPRRRNFKTVPMILTNPDQWDHEALSEVLAYKPVTKQAWDNTDIGGAWLSGMRNSLNAQIWSFKHPDFLIVSETHGTAHVALYDQDMWDKYQLSKLAGPDFTKNTLILDQPGASAAPEDYENPAGVYSPENNSIPALQRRGVVFMSCHNAIWEQAARLHKLGQNPDKVAVEAIAAELTNHLIPGVVLTPGAVATLPELQRVGFHYLRS